MKKVFDQTVRDIKREVNKKVLKVPGIEQKVLDATSNEPWGPHGSYLADIAQATRNYNEYQMIMMVLWKRINDTGKNWRHVYKGLTVLEYLVAHGSERVIDEIREHAYQISTLSDFQYIDSSGRDQGNVIRKKSQSLVSLVNDKERIQEVREKAFANKDKYRPASSTGGMYRPSSYSGTGGYGDRYDDDRYEGRYRDDDRNDGREREWGYRDDDRYGRGGESRNGDRYGRESDERYGRDGYRDDDYRRNRGNDDQQYGSRSRSSDRERDRSYEDDERYSSRTSGGKPDEQSSEERKLDHKQSEGNISAPPSYEQAVNGGQSFNQDERGGVPVSSAQIPRTLSPAGSANQNQVAAVANPAASVPNKVVDTFDEFDPRAFAPAAQPAASPTEMDLLGGLSDSASANSLALVPLTSVPTTPEPDVPTDSGAGSTFVPPSSAPSSLNQPSEDLFGDGPFRAIPADGNFSAQQQTFAPVNSAVQPQSLVATPHDFVVPNNLSVHSQSFGPANNSGSQQQIFAPSNNFLAQPQSYSSIDIPTSQPQSYGTMQSPMAQSPDLATGNNSLPDQLQNLAPTNNYTVQPLNFAPSPFHSPATEASATVQPVALKVESFSSFGSERAIQGTAYAHSIVTNNQIPSSNHELASFELPVTQQSGNVVGYFPQPGQVAPVTLSIAPTPIAVQVGYSAPAGLPAKTQPPKEKFETKSTVWADTLSRGLVDLNISGPKTNPLADIGVDFDSINRKEKRKEKTYATPVISTTNMGKAMGAGSGIGRAGATVLRPSQNPMVGQGIGMGIGVGASAGMGGGMGMGTGMVSYGAGMNQPMGMNMGMGGQMRPGTGFPPGPGYNPMMGMGGGYAPQQPYGGYR